MDENIKNKIESNIQKLFQLGRINEAKALELELEKYSTHKNVIPMEIKNHIENKQYNEILTILKNKSIKRQYSEVIQICDYLLRNTKNNSFAHYFLGIAYNGLEDYENSMFHHKKALELNDNLADIARGVSKYKYKYDEAVVNCIGCGCKKSKIIHVCNQSISEDNKELINPIRVWNSCEECGLIYANPSPDKHILDRYYDAISVEKFGGIYGNIEDRFEMLVCMANKRLERIERILGKRGTLLDIGTGMGLFVGVALDKNWIASGLEFNGYDCNYAKVNFGIDLIQKNFYDFKENEVYDVVTLFEVIEHLSHPLDDLKQISKLVKKNGLLVLATPIQDSLYGKKSKEQNIFWNVVTHLSYFKKDVISKYLNEAGFDILEIHESDEGFGRIEFYCEKR